MGGRGAYSFIRNMQIKNRWSGSVLGPRVPKTLSEALGKKGKPFRIADAVRGANPHFSNEYSEYSMNCQRCVVAYELRRRGYNVEAAPTYKGDRLPYEAHSNKDGTSNGYWMGAFKGARSEYVGAARNSTVRKNIESKMQSYGTGARATIMLHWQKGRAHVFNVENVNGKMHYVDAQTGKPVKIGSYLAASRPLKTQIVRTDNLKISERAKYSVIPARS